MFEELIEPTKLLFGKGTSKIPIDNTDEVLHKYGEETLNKILVKALTIALNAPPMTTPTERSRMLPLVINFLKSNHNLLNAFGLFSFLAMLFSLFDDFFFDFPIRMFFIN